MAVEVVEKYALCSRTKQNLAELTNQNTVGVKRVCAQAFLATIFGSIGMPMERLSHSLVNPVFLLCPIAILRA